MEELGNRVRTAPPAPAMALAANAHRLRIDASSAAPPNPGLAWVKDELDQAPGPGPALVVVPCLNEAEHLPGLLAQLLSDEACSRIVVADGGSADGSQAIVEQIARSDPRLVLLHNSRRVQSAAVNLAVRKFGAGMTWLVRVDAHCVYPDHYVRGLVAAAVQSGAGSVVTSMVTKGRSCFQLACAAAQNSLLGAGGSAHRRLGAARFVDHGHHALFRLAEFIGVGGYDEAFSHNEDAELDARLVAAGGRIWLQPSLAIGYYPRATPAALFRQYLNYGRGRAMTLQRHHLPLKLRQTLPLAVAPSMVLGLAAPLYWPLGVPAAVWALTCLALGLILALTLRRRCALLSGVAAMIMHLAWSLGFWSQMIAGRRPGPPPEAIPC